MILSNLNIFKEVLIDTLEQVDFCNFLGQPILLGLLIMSVLLLLLKKYFTYYRAKEFKKLTYKSAKDKTTHQQQFRQQKATLLESKKKILHLEATLAGQQLSYARHQVIINQIINFIKKIVHDSPLGSLNLELEQLSINLEMGSNQDKRWEIFALEIEKLHPRFLSNLLKHTPSLKSRDLRLCTYIRLGMGNQEIAKLLAIEVASVSKARHRLKKKLSLKKELDLNQFLLSL